MLSYQAFGQSQKLSERQDSLIVKYLKNGAYKHHYTTQGWSDNIEIALAQDSSIALLWQLKALPYWKTKKYSLALDCYDKAVQLDRAGYLGRRGYLKCIFQKDYRSAIVDMQLAAREFGYSYQNDHSYPFYISLCLLQLNDFAKAKQVLQEDFNKTIKERGENSIHFLDMFYMGVINYELKKYSEAVACFNKTLASYKQFSDAKYYKGLCLLQMGHKTEAELLMKQAKADAEQGYTINEDDVPYETYPYQVNWHMAKWTIPNYRE